MTKKHVYRVGDYVKIVTSKFIKRVGYPLIWTDLIDEVNDDPSTLEAYRILRPNFNPKKSIPFDLIRAIAKMRVEERGFGGNERALIYYKTCTATSEISANCSDEMIDFTGYKLAITGKKVVKTGIRIPETGGYDEWSGEYWNEPGGLENCKTHVLLRTVWGWVEETNVEPL